MPESALQTTVMAVIILYDRQRVEPSVSCANCQEM